MGHTELKVINKLSYSSNTKSPDALSQWRTQPCIAPQSVISTWNSNSNSGFSRHQADKSGSTRSDTPDFSSGFITLTGSERVGLCASSQSFEPQEFLKDWATFSHSKDQLLKHFVITKNALSFCKQYTLYLSPIMPFVYTLVEYKWHFILLHPTLDSLYPL